MTLILIVLSLICIYKASRLPFHFKFPLLVFCIAYLITVAIGATLIAMPHNYLTQKILKTYGITRELFDKNLGPGYHFLLYIPFIIPITIVLLLHRYVDKLKMRIPGFFNSQINLLAYCCVLAVISIYLWSVIAIEFKVSNVMTLFQHSLYKQSILMRAAVEKSAGAIFYPLLYMSLPTLSHIALFQWQRFRSRIWLIVFLISAINIILLVLCTLQKGPLVVYALSIALGIYVLNPKRIYALIVGACVGMVIITGYQYFLLSHSWHLLNSLNLVIFRTAASFPFYYLIYPDVIPFSGPDFALDLLGLTEHPAKDNLIIFHYMYPYVSWVQGAAAAPSHMVAYSQGGYTLAILTLLLIGILVLGIGCFARELTQPIPFAFFTQNLISLYWLTQVPVRSALLTGYGMLWTLIALILLWMVSKLLDDSLQEKRIAEIN
jgi:hypothetical protein